MINYCKGQRSQKKNNLEMPTLCNERMNSSEFQVQKSWIKKYEIRLDPKHDEI